MVCQQDLNRYNELLEHRADLFNINIIFEIMSHDDVDQIADKRLLEIANVVKDCYLKDDADYSLAHIVDGILLNYHDIKEQELGPREILRKYM